MKTVFRVAALCAGTLFAGFCSAQDWPNRPIHLITAFPPGGPADLVARLIAPKLSESFGQPVVVDNRAGAGGNIAAAAVAKSAPDGYTALVTTSAIAVNATLYANPGYTIGKDLTPVVNVATQPNLIFINTKLPVQTLAEFIDYARNLKLGFATPGSGTTPDLTAEHLFRIAAKLDMLPIHFKGAGPAAAAVVEGEPPVGAMAIAAPLPFVRSGKVRALAVSSSRRMDALPGVPTLTELGYPGMEDYTWTAVFLPGQTPSAIVQKFNEALNRAIQDPDFRKRLETPALEPVGGSTEQFAAYVSSEIDKWGKLVRALGIKAE